MPSPTFVTSYTSASGWASTTTPKTTSVTVANGDTLCVAVVGDGGGVTVTPSGGGLTYTSRATVNTGTAGLLVLYVAECNSAQTFTLSVAVTGGGQWNFDALRFSNARDAANGGTTTNLSTHNAWSSLTTLNANSSVVSAVSDFNASVATGGAFAEDGATSNIAGVTVDLGTSSPNYGYGVGYWQDAGTAAAHTFGVTNGTNLQSAISIANVEVKYQAAAAGPNPPRQTFATRAARVRAAFI